jgi:fatty-acyl-CoA synthase
MSGIWSGTVSAGPASPARLMEAVDRFGPFVDIVYGMSEIPFIAALPKISYDPAHPERMASCGKPWGDVSVEIRDPDGGLVPVGQIGEICVASDDLLLEAYVGNDPELTTGRLVDGWLRTGDAGRFDADGYLYVVDRLHDVVLSTTSSELIYCRPIEDALIGHPAVREAAVIGTPDPVMGEAVYAYVVPVPGATVTAEELRQFMLDTVNEWWTPHHVEFIDALPLNESGKVDKKLLRARHATGAAAAP